VLIYWKRKKGIRMMNILVAIFGCVDISITLKKIILENAIEE
jgi:hypothetical protein